LYEFDLPWPPSVNQYYRKVGPRILIAEAGREYRKLVKKFIYQYGFKTIAVEVNLRLEIEAYPPDRRIRDVDNIQKPILDSLAKAKFYVNDKQVKELETKLKAIVPGGALIIRVFKLEDYL